MSARATNVSFEPALNATTPDEFVVPTNCLRRVNCVSVKPEFLVVKSVLITLFGSFSNALFLSASVSLGRRISSKKVAPLLALSSPASPAPDRAFAFAPPTSVPFNVKLFCSLPLLCGACKIASAVKFSATVAAP